MNSKWQIHRIGLIDFWYYDEEEFYFLDGRMLLRGSNGSGKSVTMQSFIPLLLDGNMRPERLDPFGSRARKMENYLLEENDEREERTGYLYMEFKRLDSQTYLTIGIGMRARKNKKLDTWYFFITDGRRMGKDIFLYKDIQSKIAYSKQELRNRIGEGGKVLDNQSDYMALVNKLVFGFDTIEEYKEMVDLLIQLRTPKLSKDFKPSVINDILSSSLAPLSEDDLRPMSEAIENMDNLKTNLDNLKQSYDAAKKIEKVYDKYNKNVLFEKARQYKEGFERLQKLDKDVVGLEKAINQNRENHKKAEQRILELNQEEEVLKEEEISLNASDAKALKEKEENLHEEIETQSAAIKSKNKALDDKKEKRIEIENTKKKKEDELWETHQEIEDNFEMMEEHLEGITFDEHEFMVKDIREHMEILYGFDTHTILLDRLSAGVDEGIDILREEQHLKRQYDDRLKQLEGCRREKDQKERELLQYENQVIECKNELLEKLYRWSDKNQQLILPKDVLQQIAILIEQFDSDGDYGEVKEFARKEEVKREGILRKGLSDLEQEKKFWQSQIEEVEQDLYEWEHKTDPNPFRSDAVKKNREVLKKKGIEFFEFYKAVDFHESLTSRQMDYLEEALLEMGILDALIVAVEDREKILQLDPGLCDKYIFSESKYAAGSIAELLNVDNPENNILFYQQIANALSGIGYMSKGNTYIDENGNYQLGVLTGTITKEYKAKFIGAKARETYRLTMINELQGKLAVLKNEQEVVIKKLDQLENNLQLLNLELEGFPKGIDLKVAVKAYTDIKDQELRIYNELRRQEEELEREQIKLSGIQEKAREICIKVYLPARLESFVNARLELSKYRKCFMQVQILQTRYCESIQYLQNIAKQLEDLDVDMDTILYDIHSFTNKLTALRANLASVKEQLALTNYDAVKERLDYCVKRLQAIPRERNEIIRESQDYKNYLETDKKRKEDAVVELLGARKKASILEVGFAKEYELGYVELLFPETLEVHELCLKVFHTYDGTFGIKKREDFISDLQETFHQNRGWLPEFQLTLDSLFEDLEQEEYQSVHFRRLDIVAKYRGVTVKFKELIQKMQMDIEEQTNLLNDQDRELFEDILTNTISKKIRAKIYSSNAWVSKMNELMSAMVTSSGLTLSLKWKNKRAEHENQLDTSQLVELLKKDAEIMKDEEFARLSSHFRSKIQEARKELEDTSSVKSFHMIMKEILDYRKWFEFQLESRKTGENKKELTDRVFFTFSGGEKAMAMYVPLFSAVVAKYQGAREDAPRLISLDEAFAGVDEMNIKDMFRLMVEFKFNFIINSQILWGDYETVPSVVIYQLLRPENVKYVTVMSYIWNGKSRELVRDMELEVEKRAGGFHG